MKTAEMRFQQRDGELLHAIQAYDGVLARRQIQTLFWPGKSKRAMDKRLSLLRHNNYIQWPSRELSRTKPVPEPVVWLGWRGAHYLAGSQGIQIQIPRKANENQLRDFQNSLRKLGYHWMREPRWSVLSHDLHVIDFRLAIESAIIRNSNWELETWINESVFRADPDVIEFDLTKSNGKTMKKKKGVVPDGSFVVALQERQRKGLDYRARFLLEMDHATHDNTSFAIEKVSAGAAYIRSAEYKRRFGANAGRWLIVTTGERRMNNLLRQIKSLRGNNTELFFASTIKKVLTNDVFTSPIWSVAGKDRYVSLLSS